MSLHTLDRAHLAPDSYEDRGREAQATSPERRVVEISGRRYEVLAHASTRSGYQGTAYRDLASNEVVIAHRGTELSPTSEQFLLDVVRADGGMVAKGINVQAEDAIEFTRLAMEKAQRWADTHGMFIPAITVTGHSLGGTLAQITAHRFGLPGETYNAFGAAELGLLQGPPAPGAEIVNHVRAIDFVSAASRHFGEVRGYATEADLLHLRRHDYGLDPSSYRPDVALMASPTTALARLSMRADPAAAALSPEGIDAHRIGSMATYSLDSSILSEANRQRYEANRTLVSAYRDDIHDIRLGVSTAARAWPQAVDSIGQTARIGADAVTVAQIAAPIAQALHNLPAAVARMPAGRIQEWMQREPATDSHEPSSTYRLDALNNFHLHGIGGQASEAFQPQASATALRSFDDPQHCLHALHAKLKSELPDYTSPNRLAQFTAACHSAGIGTGNLASIDIDSQQAVFQARAGWPQAVIDMSRSAPSVQESLQRVQEIDQQRLEREQERQSHALQSPEQMRAGPAHSLGP